MGYMSSNGAMETCILKRPPGGSAPSLQSSPDLIASEGTKLYYYDDDLTPTSVRITLCVPQKALCYFMLMDFYPLDFSANVKFLSYFHKAS